MKQFLTAVFFLLAFSSFSQSVKDFTSIDYAVISVKNSSLDSLSYNLTHHYKTEEEKVRSIFRWITENITYQTKSYIKPNRNGLVYKEDTSTVFKTLEERVAEETLIKRMAVCDGYAKLFKTLCNKAGIEAAVITGYGRVDMSRPNKKFRSNHSWNAVLIDSSWHLLDVTWASGYFLNNSTEFVKSFDDYYFLTPPAEFLKSHYPENPKWTLLENPPILNEFHLSPFKPMAFSKYKIVAYNPVKGIIDARLGDTINLEIEIDKSVADPKIAPNQYNDEQHEQKLNWLFLHPSKISKTKAFYTYVVTDVNKEWLHIMYNDDVILQYRLNIKKTSHPESLISNRIF